MNFGANNAKVVVEIIEIKGQKVIVLESMVIVLEFEDFSLTTVAIDDHVEGNMDFGWEGR
jgi:hypothetical protein